MLIYNCVIKTKLDCVDELPVNDIAEAVNCIVREEASRNDIKFAGLYKILGGSGSKREKNNSDTEQVFACVAAVAFDMENYCPQMYFDGLKKKLKEFFENDNVELFVRETTPMQVYDVIKNKKGQLERMMLAEFATPSNRKTFSAIQNDVSKSKITLKEAIERAKKLYASKEYIDELKRVFSKKNKKEYCGHPVHYKITGCNRRNLQELIELLLECLYKNKRILGTRMDLITEMKAGAFNLPDLSRFIDDAEGVTLVVDATALNKLHNTVEVYNDIIESLATKIEENRERTLCIIADISGEPGFAGKLEERLSANMVFVNINEGRVSAEDAEKQLEQIILQSNMSKFYSHNELSIPEKTDGYNISDIYSAYASWRKDKLQKCVYKAYADISENIEKKTANSTNAYDELMDMVGLDKVKHVVKELLASYKINKRRAKLGLNVPNYAMHMVFSGNPGSAKTTVARLLAQILADNGVIKTGKLVECGRADLVGKYIGWTADIVKNKFKEAKGGVLFIDEAYSLVGEDKDFGTEAINTIVQEMENHRDDTVVIFAGYPEKMQAFINQNDGLKSRILFHLDFPDYTCDELVKILEQMLVKRDYELSEAAKLKCISMFSSAMNEHNFGNGRYVRNVLEQAILQQAVRLDKLENQDYTLKQLKCLEDTDFVFDVKPVSKAYVPMGLSL